MATVINNPSNDDSDGGMGFLAGLALVIFLLIMVFYFGLPLIRNTAPQTGIGGGAPPVNVPDKININLNGTK